MMLKEHDILLADAISFRNPSFMQDKLGEKPPQVESVSKSVSVLAVTSKAMSLYKNGVPLLSASSFYEHTHTIGSLLTAHY